ncbi:DUF6221 family protein [Streptomyces stelliscabiei]|uniref:DUF6221 family protein n=1 Tax=Streptomyces stelliscabiei TaxID=146820 RepID=UPI0029BB7C6A|nr:DUF6221 family protein [Streptomyces stelliscabiei]MDX2513847.1 DUF6221 family protein [Streptomyces stelliscabiei]
MPDLHGWITQQIDETQRIAEAARGHGEGRWRHDPSYPNGYVYDERGEPVVYDESAPFPEEAAHIAFNDPASVLRRCAADRKILDVHEPAGTECDPYACNGCGVDSEYGHEVDHTNDCPTLQALAEGYGLTEEQRAALDRPERERPVYPGKTGDVILDSIASMYAGMLLGTRLVEPSPKEKAMKILEPELKKIPGYVPTTEEQQ